jgi:diacylglycerol kinase family enzyme
VKSLDAAPIDATTVMPVEVDGESPGRLPARFDVQPDALRLRFPLRR